MKTNIVKLVPAHEKSLRVVQQKIQEAIAVLDKLDDEQSKLEKKLDSTNAEINDIERSANALDDDAMLRLAGKRTQLERVRQRLLDLDGDREKAVRQVTFIVPVASDSIDTALESVFQAQFDGAVGTIEQFCDNVEQARDHVRSFSFFQQQTRFGSWANSRSIASARLALQHIEKLLRGESPFSFEPESGPDDAATRSSMLKRVARVAVN